MSLPTAPSRTMDPDTFDATTEAFIGALPQFEIDMNTASSAAVSASSTAVSAASQAANSATNAEISSVSAAASAATAGALVTASDWISGGTYAVGDIRVSPANRRLYKCILAAGAGQTTDPSSDTTYWKPALFDSFLSDARFAAVSASLPALSYVDTVFHLAKDDTDKGAWRKKKGQSWRSEARSAGKYLGSYANATAATAAGGATGDVFYNTGASAFHEITAPTTSTVTYRAGREDYPTNALITAEAARVIIWDLDTAVPSMWATQAVSSVYASTSSIFARDGFLFAGCSAALLGVNFATITSLWVNYTVSGKRNYSGLTFNNAGSALQYDSTKAIVNNTVNDVAITILPDAPVDEYGMPVPNITAFTGGGVSEIKNDGTVVNSASTTAAYGGSYDNLNRVRWNTTTEYNCSPVAPRAASFTASSATEPKLSAAAYSSSNVPITPAIATGTGKSALNAVASTNGLTVYRAGQSSNALYAAITSTYNTGYVVGDIRRAIGYDSASALADKCIKAGSPVEVGTLTKTPVSGGRTAVSGFSNANYIQEASHADWNALGTGNFSIIMSGVKWGTAATLKTLLSIGDGASEGSIALVQLVPNTLRLYIWNSTPSAASICTSTATLTDTAEHVVEVKRGTFGGVANTVQILVDGVVVASAVSTLTISNATGYLRVGEGQDASYPWTGGQYSGYVRISATAPTAEQSKLIAAQENALNGGLACLLSNSNAVSALSYDKDTDSYLVGNGTNVDTFKGLKRIASQAHGVTTLTGLASVNGRKLIAGTGATYTAPERNISAELLEGQQAKTRTQNYSFTSSGTTWKLPQGWKAQGVQFNLTDGTMASASQTFDGFIWTLGSLTTAKAYQIQLVEV